MNMLILRVLGRRQLSNTKNTCYQIRHVAAQAEAKKKEEHSEIIKEVKFNLPAPLPKKPKREPFVPNFFLGNFDYEFMAFPEPQQPDRYNEFEQFFKPLEAYLKSLNAKEFEDINDIPSHVIEKLREFGVFGARIHQDYRGLNLLESEYVQILEAASTVPALGLFLYKQGVSAVDIFSKYGTVEQKLKYLTKIAAGYCIPTIAITEADSGPSTKTLNTVGVLSNDEKHWLITGEKMFVANSNLADVFIVFGHAIRGGDYQKRPETLTAFLVDKKTDGITVHPERVPTVGLKGFNMGKISFKDCPIPVENILGQIGDGASQLVENFTNTRHFIGAITIGILKDLLNNMTKDILHRKFLDGMVYETDSASKIISSLTQAIYSMESVLYMTTAMMDVYEDQDIKLETALVEQFCVEECLNTVQNCMWLIGPRASTLQYPYERIMRDAFTVTNYETSLIDTKIYSGLLALQHFGLSLATKIKKLRNPLHYPFESIKKTFWGEKKLNLNIDDHLHPTLQEPSQFLDRCIYELKESIELLLIRDGTNVGKNHSDLHRISEMAARTYVYAAQLSRTSRSYCIGNRNSDSEIKMAAARAYKVQKEVRSIAEDIKNSEYVNGDFMAKELTKLHFGKKNYIAAHPLQRNY